jgi:hypothetical protein
MRAASNNQTAKRFPDRNGCGCGRRLWSWLLLCAGLWLSALPFSALAQSGGSGIPYSSVFRETGNRFESPLKDQVWEADPQLKIGQGGAIDMSAIGISLDSVLRAPLTLAPPPDTMFRFGRLYLDIPSSYLEVVASDNAYQEKNATEQGVISVVGTDFDMYFQVTDHLCITGSGTLIYLPSQGEFGVAGRGFFGDTGTAGGQLDIARDLSFQISYDGKLGDWDFFARDRIGLLGGGRYGGGLYAYGYEEARLSLLANNDFDKMDRLGKYTLGEHNYANSSDDIDVDSSSDDRWEIETSKFNTITVGVSRMIPTDTLVGLTAWRYDRFDSSEGDGREWGEGINLSLINQHYNMRLKPYLTYTTSRNDDNSYWTHVARLGVQGPLSEYTDLDANAGYEWHEAGDNGEPAVHQPLWRISVTNDLNDLTTHRLTYARSVGEYNGDTNTVVEYDLHRTLGPRLEGVFYARWTKRKETVRGKYSDGNDETWYDAGAGVTWDASSRLTITLRGFLRKVQEKNTNQDYEQYRVRLGTNYSFSDSLSLWLSYEYTLRDDERPNDSYRENLIRMRLTKTW